ncbi:unnamed protein product, partial [Allacma fusca]
MKPKKYTLKSFKKY